MCLQFVFSRLKAFKIDVEYTLRSKYQNESIFDRVSLNETDTDCECRKMRKRERKRKK